MTGLSPEKPKRLATTRTSSVGGRNHVEIGPATASMPPRVGHLTKSIRLKAR